LIPDTPLIYIFRPRELVFYGNITGDGAGFLIFCCGPSRPKLLPTVTFNDHSAIFRNPNIQVSFIFQLSSGVILGGN
jgi:hypothetical protein